MRRQNTVNLRALALHPLLLAALLPCGCLERVQGPSPPELPPAREIEALMLKVADAQLADPGLERLGNGWNASTFYAGLFAAHRLTQAYRAPLIRWGDSCQWVRDDAANADSLACAQTYFDLCLLETESGASPPSRWRAPMEGAVSRWLPRAGAGRKVWHWADALFMAPPALARLNRLSGDPQTLEVMDRLFRDTVEHLRDPATGLFYRDAKWFYRAGAPETRSRNGKKIFWARGNAWVLAGTARVLQSLPEGDPRRGYYEQLLRDLAAALAPLQGADGFWRMSLLDAGEFPAPEASSTGLICHALAWGLNAGALDRQRYLPVVQRAWSGLAGAVDEGGRLRGVQPGGVGPRAFPENHSEPFGVGAFLLAAGEVYRFSAAEEKRRAPSPAAVNP